jgi:ectoine hydroxylase-related dioxygenase (phytanoyl-CoA dioxygenase family)
MDELYKALTYGPGVLVIRNLLSPETIDRTEEATKEIKANHHGSRKTSVRTAFFNLQHARDDPETYAEYYGNEMLALICEAWLGPGYQITTSTNGTFKGGEQQAIHRDYREYP